MAAAPGVRPRLRRGDRRPGVGGAQGVRVVRVLQGARGGLRAAHLPVGLAQGPPHRGVPRRRADPRPGHVPQAAHPRRRPPVRHHRAAPRRQPLRRHLPRGAGGRRPHRGGATVAAGGRLRHPAGPLRGEGHVRGRGRPDRGGPSLRLPVRLLAPGLGLAAGGGAAGADRRLRRPLLPALSRTLHGQHPHPADPPRPAAAGRRARPVVAGGGPWSAVRALPPDARPRRRPARGPGERSRARPLPGRCRRRGAHHRRAARRRARGRA